MYPKRLVEVSFENLVAEFPIFQKNNVTSASFTRTQSGTTDQGSLSASFTYNSNGFPITGTPISGPAGTGFKVFYVYN